MTKERKNGNRTVERSFTLTHSLTVFDLICRRKSNLWIERWGDEPYRSVWINPKELTTTTYCEGDITKVICDNQGAFLDELREVNEFYKQY